MMRIFPWLLILACAAAQAQTGLLRIVSQSGVAVEWEGVELGETDDGGVLEIGGIPPGKYSLTLHKAGFQDLSTRITVESGDTNLSLRLKPVSAAPPVERASPPPPPQRAKAKPVPVRDASKHSAPIDSDAADTEDSKLDSSPSGGVADIPKYIPPSETVAHQNSDPEAPQASTDALAKLTGDGDSPSPEPRSSGLRLILFTMLLGGAGVSAWLYVKRQEAPSRASHQSEAPKRFEPDEASEPAPDSSEGGEGSWFLEDLKEREENVRSATTYREGRQVIEVEVTDVEIVEDET